MTDPVPDPEDSLREALSFDLHHPHDHLFRRPLGEARMASAYLHRMVPPSLRGFVDDPARMTLENVSFVSEELRGSQSDLLWRCAAPGADGDGIYIYVLFEHQSEPHPIMPARLLFYMVRIWERHLAAPSAGPLAGRPFPFIFPVVLYQGAATWNSPLFFRELVGLPAEELRAFVPDFTYALECLQGTRLEGIDPAALRLVLLVMKLAGEGGAAAGLSLVCEEMDRLPAGAEADRIKPVLLLYLFAAARPEDHIAMIQELKEKRTLNIGPVARNALEALILDGVEKGRQEGWQEGREEGREEGLSLARERLIAAGMDEAEVRRILGSSDERAD